MDLALVLAGALGICAYAYRRPTALFGRALGVRLRASGLRAAYAKLPPARVHYWSGGRGDPVVLVHGFGTEAAVNWHAQLPVLRKHYRVVAPDLPGFGLSGRGGDDYSIARQVKCLRDLIDHARLDRVRLVGHSMGGWISLAFAAAHPERVARLVVVDAAGLRFEVDPALQRILLPETLDDVTRLIAANFQRQPWLPRFVLRDVMRTCRRETPTRTEVLRQLISGDDFLDGQLARISAPTLIVWGRHDILTPVSLGERLVEEIRDARLVVFEDCAHSPNIEQAGRFNALLIDFLADARIGTSAPITRRAANS